MKGEWFVMRGARAWQRCTRYCLGRPFAATGYLIGGVIFLFFVNNSANHPLSRTPENAREIRVLDQPPPIMQLAEFIKGR